MSSAHAALFAGLPAPQMGKLTLYVFGPGFGESQVVALPDGKWMLVDSCVHRGVNLPLELLRHFDAPAINLLVVTHPDLDHYKGLPELIAAFKVERLWRYPGFHTAREIILSLERGETDNKSLRELRRMQDAMLPLMRSASGREAAYDTRLLPEPKDYRIHCIAPCPQEKVHETERLGALFKRVEQGKKLTKDEKRWLMGKANRLSLAVVIWWDNIGILLGGDVEHEDGTPDRGWPGILAVMNEDETLGLVQGLRIVKIPHHGSKGAFCEQAWKHHASKGPIEIAVSTRFNKSANPPPHPSGLDKLIPYAQQLAITSPPGDFSPVITAGWLPVSHASGPGDAACVAITLAPEPPSSLDLSAQAALFASPMTVSPNAG